MIVVPAKSFMNLSEGNYMAVQDNSYYAFEKAILKASTLREKNLYGPASKAAEDPEIGIVIKQKPAYFVIKDCANITKRYLFIMCYGSLTDPIQQLKGTVNAKDIKDFVKRSKNKDNPETLQLLKLVIHDIQNYITPPDPDIQELDISFDIIDGENVYGDYEELNNERLIAIEKIEAFQKARIDLNDEKAVVDRLTEIFV